ncbi:MAG: tRNA pseudouridine(38-40) synthase TruA [Clostridia bacterium]|nr:MAG: tRNA pseudouridine(38-40) synthase TruA [Clostridia bacterium]
MPTRHLKLTVAYDGSAFHGWQEQPAPLQVRTVQGVMRERLQKLTGEDVSPLAASRTDAGVHARGQVVRIVTAATIPLDRWPQAANSVLPPDVAVREAVEVPPAFHPILDATWKTYAYTLLNSPVRSPRWRQYSLHVPYALEVGAMDQAAAFLLGTHDFSSFCAAGSGARTRTRTVYAARVTAAGPVLRFTITADGFLYHMVRIIVGTLLLVGQGKLRPPAMAEILAAKDRNAAGPTAPPHGLCLEQVGYAK